MIHLVVFSPNLQAALNLQLLLVPIKYRLLLCSRPRHTFVVSRSGGQWPMDLTLNPKTHNTLHLKHPPAHYTTSTHLSAPPLPPLQPRKRWLSGRERRRRAAKLSRTRSSRRLTRPRLKERPEESAKRKRSVSRWVWSCYIASRANIFPTLGTYTQRACGGPEDYSAH
ncbi:hypothetical protein PHLGIDRAFT_132981 [Phlebiopsis gigantea 11061_1 CR5-6]|uniref:Uncharacterized protein n=1 Tax=Phlebiopsis gigantea (strain 11061_1 CR5-6) TaxID=745531 RepID=A0A0C3SFU4_PHLG1|nr:hypothetical protein PHLGIDRAFT_132981 [Phlebiopsis gigantea 11061_1 CR5-6]